ncbi:hypothetical protein ACFL3H_10240 [Gemmatimonadota bacterium]
MKRAQTGIAITAPDGSDIPVTLAPPGIRMVIRSLNPIQTPATMCWV